MVSNNQTSTTTDKSNLNDSVIRYLDGYRQVLNPQYAVLLTGLWGCGKTWFIKEQIKRYDREDHSHEPKYKKRPKNNIYVSLFGVKSVEDIENLVMAEITSPLKKGLKVVGGLAKSFIKLGAKIYLDEVLGDSAHKSPILGIFEDFEANISTDDIPDSMAKGLKPKKSLFIVFDDLERAEIHPVTIMGYINNLTEHHNVHAVIVADERKLQGSPSSDGAIQTYAEVKEKLVGRTLVVEQDIDGIYDSFLIGLEEDAQQLLIKHKEMVIAIYHASGYNNLRSLKQAFGLLEFFYHHLPYMAKSIPELIKILLGQLILATIEMNKSMVDFKKCVNLLNSSSHEFFLWEAHGDDADNLTDEEKRFGTQLSRYSRFGLFNNLHITDNLWLDFFQSTQMDPNSIEESLKENSSFFKESSYPWSDILNSWYIDNDCFESALKEAENQFFSNQNPLNSVQNLLKVTDYFIWFSDETVLPRTKDEVVAQFKTHLNSMDEFKVMGFDSEEIATHRYSKNNFFRENVLKYALNKRDQIKQEKIKEIALQLKKMLEEQSYDDLVSAFKNNQFPSLNGVFSLGIYEFLHHINIDDFISKFLSIGTQNIQCQICKALNLRMKMNLQRDVNSRELEWYKKLVNSFENMPITNLNLSGRLYRDLNITLLKKSLNFESETNEVD